MTAKRTDEEREGVSRTERRIGEMLDALDQMVGALPELDRDVLKSIAETAQSLPANAYPRLLEKLESDDLATAAAAFCILRECGDARLKDALNGLIFDFERSDVAKVRANELLAEFGCPVDADVVEMSVANAQELAAASPWSVLRAVDAGDVKGAAARLREFDAHVRALLIHAAAGRNMAAAVPFCEAVLAAGDESDVVAVASALAQGVEELAAPLLTQLAESESKDVQKVAKRGLFALRGSGVAVEETLESAPEAPAPAPEAVAGEHDLPVHRALIARTPDGRAAVVAVAREYPNARLKALITVVDLYRRGIRDARHWVSMSRAEFRRRLSEGFDARLKFEEATLDECRRLVARGVRVARELGTPIPFDFQSGKAILGDLSGEAARIEQPFPCSRCGAALSDEQVTKIKAVAGFDMPVETRCPACVEKEREQEQ